MAETPSPELVCISYLRSVLTGYGITTKLPKLTVTNANKTAVDNWSGNRQWITSAPIAGGPVPNLPMRKPIVAVDVWGKPRKPGGDAPWGEASVVAEKIIDLATDWYRNVTVAMYVSGYKSVRLSSFSALTEARRVPGDPAGLAHYVIDVELAYTPIS